MFGMPENTFFSCYPELKDILATSKRAEIESQQRQKEVEAALEQERNKPENQLMTLYDNYLVVRVCYENRKGYALVYVTDTQMEEGRRAVKIKEQDLQKRFPTLGTNKIWEESSQRAKGLSELLALGSGQLNESMKLRCSLALAFLLSSSDGYTTPAIKKDF